MKVSVAQIRPVKGDVSENIEKHKKLISLALQLGADAIFFSELSLTGYEPDLAKELATNLQDIRFDAFQEISDLHNITIGLGMPTHHESGINISMIIFQPNKFRSLYSKQLLHSDEFPYFINGEKQILLSIGNKKVAPAICFESLQMNHAEKADSMGAEIYLASVAKPQNGINKGFTHYPLVAQKFSIPVLMSNSVGFCDNFESVGKSSVWNKNGHQLAAMDNSTEGVLVYDTDSDETIIRTL